MPPWGRVLRNMHFRMRGFFLFQINVDMSLSMELKKNLVRNMGRF